MYNEQYIKTELNSFGDKISIHFHDQRIPTFNCVCLSVILIYPVVKMGKNYYPQVFLEECKYIV